MTKVGGSHGSSLRFKRRLRLKLLLGDSLGDEELDEVMNEVDAFCAARTFFGRCVLLSFPAFNRLSQPAW